MHFGDRLQGEFENADEVSEQLDKQIIKNYILHPSNYFAYQRLHGEYPQGNYSDEALPFESSRLPVKEQEFEERLAQCPVEQRPYWLAAYANPIVSKQNLGFM